MDRNGTKNQERDDWLDGLLEKFCLRVGPDALTIMAGAKKLSSQSRCINGTCRVEIRLGLATYAHHVNN
jgi:hypothetical protein